MRNGGSGLEMECLMRSGKAQNGFAWRARKISSRACGCLACAAILADFIVLTSLQLGIFDLASSKYKIKSKLLGKYQNTLQTSITTLF